MKRYVSRKRFLIFPDPDPNSHNQTAGQVWYEISLAGLNLNYPANVAENPPATGWIMARISNFQPGGALGSPDEYFYIEDRDPCGNEVGEPETLTFTYDRRAAAEYAITHSYNNNTTARSANRVTERIVGYLPYAEFIYSELNPGGPEEATGSAQFVSEALWVGSMPMTAGNDNNCSQPWPAVNFGWRYCSDVNTSSKAWSVHKGIGIHFTDGDFSVPSSGSGTILSDSGTTKGEQILFQGLAYEDRIYPLSDWIQTGIFTNITIGVSQWVIILVALTKIGWGHLFHSIYLM
ncbi:MAG: hypothetical protein OHK0046_00060 [Anaerolineae bacterium]